MRNKKGADFTIGMLIAIVLGILVLAVVALGFIGGWQNLLEKFRVYGGGGTLTSVGQACQVACSSGDSTAFCNEKRTVSGLTEAELGSLGTFYREDKKLEVPNDPAKNLSVSGSEENWKVGGLTCEMLVDGNLITLSDCTPPVC